MKSVAVAFALLTLATPATDRDSSMTAAAMTFVASLDEVQRGKAVLPLSSPDRSTWTYVPGQRLGVAWNELTDTQRESAHKLLRASLSKQGYEKIEAIRGLEPVLAAMENGNASRDPERYWFVFFGTPDRESPWLWRYEGHHISLTFASNGGVLVASTPQFLGSNPAQVKSGERKGFRALAKEQDLAFRLIESLDEGQRKQAVLAAEAPTDIITANSRKAAIEGRLGLRYSEMSADQQKLLRSLLLVFASVQTEFEQKRRLAAIEKEGHDEIVFAWLGPVSREARHYYRIQGRSFVVEYDNTQNDGNHIHTVWRDLKHDFGEDVLAVHYAQSHDRR